MRESGCRMALASEARGVPVAELRTRAWVQVSGVCETLEIDVELKHQLRCREGV